MRSTSRTQREGEERERSSTVHKSDTRPLPGSLDTTAAAIEAAGRRALTVPADLLDKHLAANVMAPLALTKMVLPQMLERGRGLGVSVVNVSPGFVATERIAIDMAEFGFDTSKGASSDLIGQVVAWRNPWRKSSASTESGIAESPQANTPTPTGRRCAVRFARPGAVGATRRNSGRESVVKTARVLLATVMTATAAFVAGAAPAAANTNRCLSHAPKTEAGYQQVPDSRDATFGIGDMTSVVRLPDGRQLFVLGDTAYYNLNANGSAGPIQSFGNNSAWVQSHGCFALLNRTGPGSRSWILPPQQDGSFYWPGASVVVGTRLYVFVQRLVSDPPFGRSLGAAVAVFDLPSLRLARITPIPWSAKRVFGGGAVYDGGFVYTYASQLRTCAFCFASDMYVARVPENEIMVPSAWRFRAGTSWVADMNAAKPVLPAAVSNTDVQPYGNGFLLITKTVSIIGPPVEAWWAPDPAGPWQDLGTVFSVPAPPPARVAGFVYQQAYTYNPVVVTGTRLTGGGYLGSYNVNTFDSSEAQRDGLMLGPRFVSIPLPPPPSASPPRAKSSPGPSPWTPTFGVDRTGRVDTILGGAEFHLSVTNSAVAVARTPTARGGWIASAQGGVFTYGDAQFYGSMGGTHLNQPIVGMAATPSGRGYWLVARDGGIFSFGDARFAGSTGNIRLNKPIVAMTASPTGRGYWFVASDGGIFTFGDAHFFGSRGGAPPGFPVTGMAATPDGRGYWLVTADGQVFSFGGASYKGNAPMPLRANVIGIVAGPGGYRIVDAAGDVFARDASSLTEGHIDPALPLVAAG